MRKLHHFHQYSVDAFSQTPDSMRPQLPACHTNPGSSEDDSNEESQWIAKYSLHLASPARDFTKHKSAMTVSQSQILSSPNPEVVEQKKVGSESSSKNIRRPKRLPPPPPPSLLPPSTLPPPKPPPSQLPGPQNEEEPQIQSSLSQTERQKPAADVLPGETQISREPETESGQRLAQSSQAVMKSHSSTRSPHASESSRFDGSKSEDEMFQKFCASEQKKAMAERRSHITSDACELVGQHRGGKSRGKEPDQIGSGRIPSASILKQTSTTGRSRSRVKHQNSSPMTPRSRTPYSSHLQHHCLPPGTSFLSNLAASRPNAATGLLGVASAALAAARAGTLGMGDAGEGGWGNSGSFEKRNSELDRVNRSQDIPHYERLKEFSSHSPLQLSVRKSICCGQSGTPKYRRNSDSALQVHDFASDQPILQIITCSNCGHKQLHHFQQPISFTPPQEHEHFNLSMDLDTYEKLFAPTDPKRSLEEWDAMCADDFDRPFLHSSWVALSTNEMPEFLNSSMDAARATSTAVLDKFPDSENELTSRCDSRFQRRRVNNPLRGPNYSRKSMEDDNRRISTGRKPSGYQHPSGAGRVKHTGLDSIGLDFMRINGARPGLMQLRHVKEFKAAKQLEQQLSGEIPQKGKSKFSTTSKSTGPLGLLALTQQSSQQNPIHQLISGGVLGATVLAMAGKDRNSPRDGRLSNKALEQEKSSRKPSSDNDICKSITQDETKKTYTRRSVEQSEEGKHQISSNSSVKDIRERSTGEKSRPNTEDELGELVSSKFTEKSDKETQLKNSQKNDWDSIDRIRQVGSGAGPSAISRLIRLRRKLTRSVTATTSGETTRKKHEFFPKCGSSASIHGPYSAPGLTRSVTEEEESERSSPQFYSSPKHLATGLVANAADRRKLDGLVSVLTRTKSVSDAVQKTNLFSSEKQIDSMVYESPVKLDSVQNDYGRQRNSCEPPTSTVPFTESGSMQSRRYFHGLETVMSEEIGDLANSAQKTPLPSTASSLTSNLTNNNYQSRVRRRRDNFQKGRSSALTYKPEHTISETTEESAPLFSLDLSDHPSKGVDKQDNSTLSREVTEDLTKSQNLIHEAATVDREPLVSQKVAEKKAPAQPVCRPVIKKPSMDSSTPNNRPNDIPIVEVEDTSQEQDSSESLTLMQRRRDAMNNLYHQKTIRNVGYRLGRRKRLFEKRCRVSDFALTFALFGIVVMVVETELTFAGVYRLDSVYSYFMKSLISFSTVLLVGLVIAYHVYAIKIFSCDDSIEDWRMAINWHRIALMTLEFLVCLIHPFPGSSAIHFPISPNCVGPVTDFHPFNYNVASDIMTPVSGSSSSRTNGPTSSWTAGQSAPSLKTTVVFLPTNDSGTYSGHQYKLVSLDLILSVPMFFRFYLMLRVMLLHSKMFTDAGSRSIGAMNKVNFNMGFIFKTLMAMCPGRLLLGFILCLWIIYSWSLRACESFYDTEHGNLLNSMWLVAVTFLSIGYGDIVPHTYCGRAIALATGLMGSGCTALIVAVFARKLELSKAEKHVIHFMMENQLNKKVKHYAANVLRETWLIYKYTKLAKRVDAARVRTHQRKFLTAIHGMRRMKMDQRKVQDSANTLVDLAKTQTNIYETVSDLRMEQSCLNHRMESLETTMLKMQEQMRALPGIIRTTVIQQHYAYQKFANSRGTENQASSTHTSANEPHK